jgi:hypothetical protein
MLVQRTYPQHPACVALISSHPFVVQLLLVKRWHASGRVAAASQTYLGVCCKEPALGRRDAADTELVLRARMSAECPAGPLRPTNMQLTCMVLQAAIWLQPPPERSGLTSGRSRCTASTLAPTCVATHRQRAHCQVRSTQGMPGGDALLTRAAGIWQTCRGVVRGR